jgi:serine/threonine-protein kinase
MSKGPGGRYFISRMEGGGLSPGMLLPVVTAPVKDGKAKLLGEATVTRVKPGRVLMNPDAYVRNAGKVELFVVLPNASTEVSQASNATPPTEAPAQPPVPRELNGRIRISGLVLVNQMLEVTNSDSFTWNDCILVARGRDVYRLGGMAAGMVREIPVSGFKKNVPGVPYVERDRVRIICAEGEKEVPVKL